MTDTTDNPSDEPTRSQRWQLVVGAVVILAALIAALLLVTRRRRLRLGDTTDVATTVSATTTPATAPSTEPSTTEPGDDRTRHDTDRTDRPTRPHGDLALGRHPTRFADPVEAATSFATDYLGFIDPIAGEFLAGDSRSGEVEIAAGNAAPTTVVFVRQLTDDDSWWILGAASENITVDEPDAGRGDSSPLTVSGTALGIRRNRRRRVARRRQRRADLRGIRHGQRRPGAGSVRGHDRVHEPRRDGGALVMISLSPEDGSVIEAWVMRIFFR